MMIMNRKSFLSLLLVAVYLLSACTSSGIEQTANGIVVNVTQPYADGAKRVRLEVMGEKLIHVSATPNRTFSTTPDWVIVPQAAQTPFTVIDGPHSVTLATQAVRATVDKRTGEVTFTDKDGNRILAEKKRSFTPYEAGGKQAYSVLQQFESVDDEGLYGLGQHQSDEFNYKGKNEELFQYNTKVSVPFIVSTRNYGILWDSYSLSRFGNPRDYSQLNRLFRLFNASGKEGCITGTYLPADKSIQSVVRDEDSLYFENLKTIKHLPENLPLMGADVVYEGELEPAESGLYRFILYYAGYTKVYIDHQLVVPERWRTAWNPNAYKFAVQMEAHKRVHLRVEWKPDGGESYCGLRALQPVPEQIQNRMTWWSEMNEELSYYFVYGTSMDDVVSGYRTLTGKSPVMPKWAMGYWQSRERYHTQTELLNTLREFRRRRIPIDNMVLDWFYWKEDQWGSHEFDATRFPDPKGMVDSIHALNAHIMISVWPKFYTRTEHFKEFADRGWMYMRSVEDSLRDWVGLGYHYGFYDAYDADARQLFWKQMHDHLYPLGIDAWWMDASEPNVRDCTDMPYRKALQGPTALGPADQYLNAYALMNAEAIYNGQRSVDPHRRVFLLTRSGFSGLQRYSTATWSGDIGTRWEDMKAQISAGLNFAVSGIPYWTMDIGGFCVERRYEQGQHLFDQTGRENADLREWRELNTRWYQFGAFCPLFRAHGQFPAREVWNIAPEGHPAYNSIVYYTQLRYRLMPYIYSLAGMTWLNDYTLMRPLVMDFAADRQTYNVGDQFLFGPALMAAPVYEYGARNRTVYFPAGADWYDFYTGTCTRGGKTVTVEAPYERMPLYVRSGSILPIGEEIQHTGERPESEITLYVFAGQSGHFTLYEDEGVNYNYEQGKYTTIPIGYNDDTRTLVIGARNGTFDGMPDKRTFRVVLVTPEHPQGKKMPPVVYDGHTQEVPLI
jgi:alpha-D-xyloside xylohydrolase